MNNKLIILPEVTEQVGITAPRTEEENQLTGILAMPLGFFSENETCSIRCDVGAEFIH